MKELAFTQQGIEMIKSYLTVNPPSNGDGILKAMMIIGVERVVEHNAVALKSEEYLEQSHLIADEYGEVVALAVMIGIFHIHVEVEGIGIQSYFDSGFLTGTQKQSSLEKPRASALEYLLRLFQKYNVHTIRHGKDIFDLLSKIEIESYQDGEKTCYRIKNAEEIDYEYYAISDLFVEAFEKHIGDLFKIHSESLRNDNGENSLFGECDL